MTVEEGELGAYRRVDDLLPHPPLRGFAAVFNWCLDQFEEECLFFVDDDVRHVKTTMQPTRQIKDPDDIARIIDNAYMAASDLDLSVFCFARSFHVMVVDPVNRPIAPTSPVCVAFGVRGPARRRRYDEGLVGRGDMDWTLRTMVEDRVVYCDTRFFFQNGRIFSGEGGNVGIVDKAQRDRASAELKRRWGGAISDTPLPYAKKRSVVPMRLRVSRSNPTALH